MPRTRGKWSQTLATHAALALGVFIFMIPLAGMVLMALKSEAQVQDVSSLRRMLVPEPVMWSNFATVFRRTPMIRYFANTFFITVMSVAGVMTVCPLVAYGFSRFRFPGRDALFFLLLATMMIPPQVTMVPVYFIFSWLGWVNTFTPLWAPVWFGVPFYIFLLRQFFMGIPRTLDEAATLDGANSFQVYFRVLLAQVRPAVITITLFQAVGSWNDFMGPLLYINSMSKMPLSLGIQSFILNHATQWPLLFAACTLMTLPMLVLFFLAQRFFIEGAVMTGIKG